MCSLSVSPVGNLDIYSVRRVLSSPKISDNQKAEFLKQNSVEIKTAFKTVMTSGEYTALMHDRPLQRFKPVKNSFTKRGDKILLAKAMDINPNEVESTIKNVVTDMGKLNNMNLSPDKIKLMRTYVYRHGTKDQVVAFLDNELSSAQNITRTLYTTLKYNTDGLADYFSRPIHRMNNKTLVQIYNVVDKNLQKAKEEGSMTEVDAMNASEWALKQIYIIQNNSKLLKAKTVYDKLT